MPIKRYVDYLRQRGELERYMRLLVDNFNPYAAEVRPSSVISVARSAICGERRVGICSLSA